MAVMRYYWQEMWLILKGYITCDCIFRCYKVHDVLAILEVDFFNANIYIQPPENAAASDEDSGEEDDVVINNLTCNQHRGDAEVTIFRQNESNNNLQTVRLADDESTVNKVSSIASLSSEENDTVHSPPLQI